MARSVDVSRARPRTLARAGVLFACASLVLAGLAFACKPRPEDPAPNANGSARGVAAGPSAAAGSLRKAAPDAGLRLSRRGGTDVTFYVVSDVHFGYGYPDDLGKLSADPLASPVGLEKDNLALLRRVNGMEGRPYPSELGGTVSGSRGLLITGDLTEWGRKEEWQRFLAFYGPGARDGGLRLPLFEVVGNHDKVPGTWVEEQVAARHGRRFHAWDWDDVHFVALGEAPDDEGIAFLERDLSRVDLDVPLVIYFHRCLLGPWSEDNWFGDGNYRERLANALQGHAVRAIFHGHHHASGHYLWHGYDVFKPGAVKNDAHTFVVAHLTDKESTFSYFDYDADAWGRVYRLPRKP